jgi:hypothetical protein
MVENKTEIIIEGNLELTEDFKTDKNLIVKGNIFGKDGNKWNINVWNINLHAHFYSHAITMNICCLNLCMHARNINALDITCEKRINKSETSKTKARIFIQNKSQLERKEW